MSVPYLNRQLFSDHWLRERLPQRDDYALTPLALAKLALWLRGAPLRSAEPSGWSAQATVEHIVAPCLALLGYEQGEWLSARLTLWSQDANLLWRYAPLTGASQLPQADATRHALVGAVAWDADLDARSLPGAERSTRAQAPALLFLRQLAQSDAEWGILTNGRRWRLYTRGSATLEASYEIDLPALTVSGDVDALHYFWLFFAATAQIAPAEGEPSFLQTALRESREYAARIEDDLRGRAFDAIQAACQALADALAAERGVSAANLSREDLAEVYADALALLYRLLFVLYAESRDLLPTHDPAYIADYSMRDLIARLPARPDSVADPGVVVWSRLARLFRALNGEERSSVVPAFSGRLFDGALHPLLARLTLADEPLARMLILLGRTQQGQQIDYADLAVRQLGSIYEGLLEHQAIAVAVEEMALAKGPKDKAALIIRRSEVGERRIVEAYPPGTVYLSNDRGERHAAGTYYTPEPVVRYLVEETLGPLVAGKTTEQVLALRVLDPAMGSAHFLVAAVDYLTRAALAAQEGRPATGKKSAQPAGESSALDSDVMELKRRIAEQCVYGVDINESAVELGKLSLWLATAAKDHPLTFLDLHLRTGNSLIGLVPGELEAAAQQTPASAKRGAKARKRATASQSAPTLPEMDAAQENPWNETAYTQAMFKVVGAARVVDMMPTDSVEAVRSKQHVTGDIEREMRRYREAADLAVSLRLGASVTPAEYRAALATLLDRGGIVLHDVTLSRAQAEARAAHERHHIFHWELEFPEVFRDGNGQPLGAGAGFDAILGNPPYVSVTTLRSADPVAWAYYPQVFATTQQGKYDLYVAFVERGLALLNARGRLAYILPNKWLTTDFGAPLRSLLAYRRAVSALVDFGSYQVFPGVSNYTCLLFAGHEQTTSIAVTKRTEPEGEIELPPTAQGYVWASGRVEASTLGPDAWNLTVGGAQTVLAKWQDWPTLKQVGTVFEGVTTGANPVFILTEVAREGEIVTCYAPALGREVRLEAALLHPVLQGRDIQPYYADDHDARLLSPYRLAEGRATLLPADELAARYPLTWAYLNDEAVRGILEAREGGRFRGRDDWYGFGYPRNMALLPEPKLTLPDVAARGRVAWDAEGHDIVDTAYGIALRPEATYSASFLLAALNSPILTFFLRHRGTDLRGGYFRMKTAYLNPFPLPPIAWTETPASERRAQAAQVVERALVAMRAGAAHAAAVPPAVVSSLAGLSGEPLHDVVATLAEHASDLAAREQAAWSRFSSLIASLRPTIIGRSDERLRFERAHELTSPDALIAACAQGGAPLTAPELATLRTAHRDTRDRLLASRREREATVAVIDRLLYQMYALSEAEITTIRGTDAADADSRGSISEQATQPSDNGVSYGKQGKRRSVAGAGERHVPQEVQSGMRTISKGGQPDMLVRCVAQALANPYSGSVEMNRAMGYVPQSSVGPHYLNTAILTGLLTETSQGWLRPTRAGRELIHAWQSEAHEGWIGYDGVWNALLSLPAYRRYLEYKILTIVERNRTRSAIEMQQIEAAAYEAFPGFRSRAVSLRQMLKLDEMTSARAITVLRDPPALEPIGRETVRAWVATQGLGPQRTHLSRAREIAQTLARAATIPLTVRSEWLEPTQLLALLLLIAARQRGQGIALTNGASRGGLGALARAVDSLRQCGIDIRLEQREQSAVATLVPAITLRIASAGALDTLMSIGSAELVELVRTVVTAVKVGVRAGLDGEERGATAPVELAIRCAEAGFDGHGEFVGAAAADEITPVESSIVIGSPLPLASDLPLLSREYQFLEDAVRGQGKHGWQGGVAVLLSDWLTQQRRAPAEELATNPHLALLYLIAADMGDSVAALTRHDTGWFLAGMPLALALDDRIRGLGYDVWDEGYRADEQRTRALGSALVEQGLHIGVLTTSDNPSFPLEAPTTYGYYAAAELLAVEPARRTAR